MVLVMQPLSNVQTKVEPQTLVGPEVQVSLWSGMNHLVFSVSLDTAHQLHDQLHAALLRLESRESK